MRSHLVPDANGTADAPLPLPLHGVPEADGVGVRHIGDLHGGRSITALARPRGETGTVYSADGPGRLDGLLLLLGLRIAPVPPDP